MESKLIVVEADESGVWLGSEYHDLDREEAAAYQAALSKYPEEIPGQGRRLTLAQLADVRAEVGRLLSLTCEHCETGLALLECNPDALCENCLDEWHLLFAAQERVMGGGVAEFGSAAWFDAVPEITF